MGRLKCLFLPQFILVAPRSLSQTSTDDGKGDVNVYLSPKRKHKTLKNCCCKLKMKNEKKKIVKKLIYLVIDLKEKEEIKDLNSGKK